MDEKITSEEIKKEILLMAENSKLTVGEPRPALRSESPKGRKYLFYRMVTSCENGWVDPKLFLPEKFDLVDTLTIKNVHKNSQLTESVCKLWWTGSYWDGSRIDSIIKVIKWRLKSYSCLENPLEDQMEDL